MLEQIQALWRPVTAAVMSIVVLLIALGWLPAAAEEHVSAILTTAGGVLAALSASRTVQRVQEVKAQAVPAGVLLDALAKVKPAAPDAVDDVKRQLAQLQAELVRIGQAVQR